jgi:hypothetical protein
VTTAEILTTVVGALVTGDIAATLSMKKRVVLVADISMAHSITIASHESRIVALETELAATRARYEDLVGFCQGQGFRKRDG